MGSSNELKTIFYHAIVSAAKAMYLLDLNQADKDGRAKAKFFVSMGFSANDPARFTESMQAHPMSAHLKDTLRTEFGKKFVFICDLNTPSDRSVCITSIWQTDNNQSAPRLITAYPAR